MQAPSPIDSNITLFPIESGRTLHAPTSADSTELKEAVEDGTVIADIEAPLLFLVLIHVVRRDLSQEIDVLICVKLRHLEICGRFCALILVSIMIRSNDVCQVSSNREDVTAQC